MNRFLSFVIYRTTIAPWPWALILLCGLAVLLALAVVLGRFPGISLGVLWSSDLGRPCSFNSG